MLNLNQAKLGVLLLSLLLFILPHDSLAQDSFVSIQSGNWEDGATWGNTSPGIAGTDYPDNNGDDDVTISSGHTVTLQSNSTINDFTINSGGIFVYDGFTLTANGTITPFISSQSGNFATNGTWLNGSSPGTTDRAIVIKSHTVTVNNDQISDLQVDGGAVVSTDNNKDLTVTSSLIVNGIIKLNQTNADLILSAGPVTLSGSGTIDGSASVNGALQVNASTTINSGSALSFLNDIDIAAGATLIIEGEAIVSSGDITGADATSQVTMGTDASLEIDGVLLATGILDASTNSGNTIEYYGTTAQTIKSPTSNTYHHLVISGTGTKTFPANALTFNGSVTINAGTLDINNQNITIGGDWENNSAFSNIGTITFDGTADQEVTNSASGQDFVTLTVNKSSGTLNLNNDLTVTSTLNMTAGNINTGSGSLTLGSGSEGTLNYTAGRIIGTFGQYIAATTTTPFTYPIGTSTNDRTVDITFDQTGGGRSAGVVYSKFMESDPGSAGMPVTDDITLYNTFNDGYWDFTVNGFSKGNSNTFDLQLEGDGFSSFTIDANTRLLTRLDPGSDWSADGTHNSVSGDSVSRSNISTFEGQFAFGDDTNCTPPADPVISGSTDVCTDELNVTYSVTLNSGNDYNWTVVGGTIDEAGGGTTTGFTTDLNSITVDWGSTGQVGSVSVVERNSCTTSNEVSLSVNIHSITPSDLTGKILVAENSTGITYSVTNETNTSYDWTITGGTQASGGSTNSITVDWGSDGSGNVSVTATKTSPSCPVSTPASLGVTIYAVVNSNGTGGGSWNDDATWITGSVPLSTESARIVAGDEVTLAGGGGDDVKNLIVNGTLNVNSRNLDVSGDLTVNSGGEITGTSGILGLTGSVSSPEYTIDGTGTLNGGFTIEVSSANKKIASTAVITQTGTGTNFNIDAGLEVTNEGSIEIGGNITGDDAASTWTNSSNSALTVGGVLLTTGVLNASASNNTVVYNTTTAANIKQAATSYQNLTIEDGTKTLTGTVDVDGTFTLTSGTLDMTTNPMNLGGDLTYTAGTISSSGGAIVMDGTANQTVTGSPSIPYWTINSTATGDAVTLSGNLTVSNTLTLTDGIVGTGGNIITVTNTATGAISSGSSDSFINGILARQTNTTSLYDFPVGASTTYKRVGITPTAAGGSTFQVEGFNTAYSDVTSLGVGLNNVSELEYWDIQRTSGTDAAQVRLYWNTQVASGISAAADLVVAHYTGGQWEEQGNGANSGDIDPGYVESSLAIVTFSPVTFGSATSSENPLPVELVSFTGESGENGVLLEWSTASELNNEYFEIERSPDGTDFSVVGKVQGQGNSEEWTSYQWMDYTPYSKGSFYRLKQVDFDGKFELSRVIFVQTEANQSSFSIYPNPVNNTTRVVMDYPQEGLLTARLFTMEGKQSFYFRGTLKMLNIILGTHLEKLQRGSYLLIVDYPLATIRVRLIK